MCDQNFSNELKLILVKARELQIARIENFLRDGFELPREICLKYRKRYLLECATLNNSSKWSEIYSSLFLQFWAEIEQNIDIPEEFNHLDQITLFGEVCLGEHSKVLQ